MSNSVIENQLGVELAQEAGTESIEVVMENGTPENLENVEATTVENDSLADEEGGHSHVRIDISQIKVDISYLGRLKFSEKTIEKYYAAYLSGAKLPAIRVEKSTGKLVDGYHRLEAQKKIYEDYKSGKIDEEIWTRVMNGSLVHVEYVEIPHEIVPSLFSAKWNFAHGMPSSKEDMEFMVARQLEVDPSFSVQKLADFLTTTYYKAETFFKKPYKAWKERVHKEMFDLRAEGLGQEEIERELNSKYPGARGISQASISEILSGKRKIKTTSKKEDKTTKSLKKKSQEPKASVDSKESEASVSREASDTMTDKVPQVENIAVTGTIADKSAASPEEKSGNVNLVQTETSVESVSVPVASFVICDPDFIDIAKRALALEDETREDVFCQFLEILDKYEPVESCLAMVG